MLNTEYIKTKGYFLNLKTLITCKEVPKNILENQSNYFIYEEPNVIKSSTYASVSSIVVHCLKSSLSENEQLSELIENILKYKNIKFDRCASSGHYVIPINVDTDGYIHIL